MKLKFCPSCGAIDAKTLSTGTSECNRCHFRGDFREAPIDEINRFQKSLKKGMASRNVLDSIAGEGEEEQKIPSGKELKEKLHAMKGKKTDDFEIM